MHEQEAISDICIFISLRAVIHLHDKTFKPFISKEEIGFALAEMVKNIQDDFPDEVPIFVGILNGSFMVVSDLVRLYSGACEVEFLKMSSYQGTASTGIVNELIGLSKDVKGRTVILVEDIVDTGHTVLALKNLFKSLEPKHLKIATLFFKPEAYQADVKLDYIGIRIPNKFIVGYGLDYDGLGRNLPEVYQVES